MIDMRTFEAVQSKLNQHSQKNIHRTSPLNNIQLDLNWVQKEPKPKDDYEKGNFFISRNEKKVRPAHKAKEGEKEVKRPEVQKLDLKENAKQEKEEKKVGKFDTFNFLSTRIETEFFLKLELKRLDKKFKEQKEKSLYR